MKLDPLVAQIIVAKSFDHFSTSDVRSAYLVLKNDLSLDPSSVRKSIYAELLKLVKKGWLTKLVSKQKGFTKFHKTELFDIDFLTQRTAVNATAHLDNTQEKLLSKLKHYKADLLLNIGESEAYKELYPEFPELVDELQIQYNNARDNNTKILGKIRAIEGLLKQDNSEI
ncbi:hypothetical protein [Pseudocolwellia agarivorans]|uniref:hypothetical protein n=1 Tax=Pseudocolwellia agarivorans TaxID=1911682 RepID=UPI003F884ED5